MAEVLEVHLHDELIGEISRTKRKHTVDFSWRPGHVAPKPQ